jgi:fumarylacetoacetase
VSTELDRSHDPSRTSWVDSANGHPEFPIQNLPYGASDQGLVVAIGDQALLLEQAMAAGWGAGLGLDNGEFEAPFLNVFLFRDPEVWRGTRLALSDALSDPAWRERLQPALRPIRALELQHPIHVGDYSDFYASIHHATNVGTMLRPDNPLLPNYKWVPIGYHGRSSTIVIDGTPIRRPHGQVRPAGAGEPTFGPTRSLDYEVELGLVIGGLQQVGEMVPAADAANRIFGVVLLNDWSARDVQGWEYQPLGPFLAKNFATTISPWLVTTAALLPYRTAMPARAAGDPAPLEYLRVPDDATWSITMRASLQTVAMRDRGEGHWQVSAAEFDEAMYWSPAQLVTHHASNGCALEAGDLLGTGTISGTTPESRGCLLERTWRGAEPLVLPDGSHRAFLEDGDEVVLSGMAHAEGRPSIGFGTCRGVVLPA